MDDRHQTTTSAILIPASQTLISGVLLGAAEMQAAQPPAKKASPFRCLAIVVGVGFILTCVCLTTLVLVVPTPEAETTHTIMAQTQVSQLPETTEVPKQTGESTVSPDISSTPRLTDSPAPPRTNTPVPLGCRATTRHPVAFLRW